MDTPQFHTTNNSNDPVVGDYDFGDPVEIKNAGTFFDISSSPCDCWQIASARKRWLYVWLVAIPLCAVASFIASITVMARATTPEQSGGAATVFVFNILGILCALSLSYCGIYLEWFIVP
jgi:hypothetical protein